MLQVQQFGLLLTLLVLVNLVLTIMWLPVCVVCWERYLGYCCNTNLGFDNQRAYIANPNPRTVSLGKFTSDFSGNPTGSTRAGSNTARPLTDFGITRPTTATMHGVPVISEKLARASGRCSYLNSRYIWGKVFNLIVPMRYVLVLGLIGASAYGLLQTFRLERADPLPKLFNDSHDVQQFINLSSKFSKSSLSACPSCLRAGAGMDLASMDTFGEAGLLAGGSNSTNITAAALMPAPSALGLTSPFDGVKVDLEELKQKRLNKSTANVLLIWGVRGTIGDTEAEASGDVSGLKLDFDPKFDLGDVTQQRIIVQQVRFRSFPQTLQDCHGIAQTDEGHSLYSCKAHAAREAESREDRPCA